jgi:predicted nucleic acid-binding protein
MMKRYIQEKGSEEIQRVYFEALNGEITLSLSVWNIGEILGAFDKYLQRKWLAVREHGAAREAFINEMTRLVRLDIIKLVPVKTSILAESWSMIEKYSIYQADAVQITSARSLQVDQLLTGDKRLAEISEKEDIETHLIG